MKTNIYKTYLFDFDGTLVDSMPSYISVMLRILDESNISYTKDIVKIITPLGYGGTAEYFRTLGIMATSEELVEKMTAYAKEEYAHRIVAKDGVKEALLSLRASGASLNVLTASPHSMLDVCLERNGIYDLFDNIWSCEDFGTTKADPEIYKMAAERLGCAVSDVLFIDDNLGALRTAKSAGMCVFGIYDPSSEDVTDEIRAAADGYIKNFSELL